LDKLRTGPKIYHDLAFEEEIKNLINTTKEQYEAYALPLQIHTRNRIPDILPGTQHVLQGCTQGRLLRVTVYSRLVPRNHRPVGYANRASFPRTHVDDVIVCCRSRITRGVLMHHNTIRQLTKPLSTTTVSLQMLYKSNSRVLLHDTQGI
jgi:hypothetical protein